MQDRIKKIFFTFLLASLLTACTLYPRYQRPCIDMPEHWRICVNETDTAGDMRWWEQFCDPALNDLIREALAGNNDLRIAAARILQFRAQLGIASSPLYPQIYGQGIDSRQRTSETLAGEIFPRGSSYSTSSQAGAGAALLPDLGQLFPIFSNNYQALITASYELDLWGKIRSAADASYSDLLGARDAQRNVVLTVVSSVAASYMLLRQYDRQLEISVQTLKSRQESLNLAKIRFVEGLTSELEVKQAASDLDQAALQVIQFETSIPVQENLLSVLIGKPPSFIRRGLTVDSWPHPLHVPAGIPASLLEQRPDIAQAEEQLKAANFRIGEARALYFPDITLTGNYGYESGALHDLFINPSKSWQWMINLLQPIFTGWKITSEVDLAEAKKLEAAYNYLQVILTSLKEVNDALISHKNAARAVAVQLTRVKDLSDYLHLATLQYENGLVDYLNVLDAERHLFEAQLDLAKNQADEFITLVNIYKALGGGWVIDAENQMKEEWLNQAD